MTTSIKFQINSTSTFSAPLFTNATNLETGEVGLLYIDHYGNLEEEKVQEAAWVVSCYLPSKYSHKSPFGGNETSQVEVTPHTNGVLKVEILEGVIVEWACPPFEVRESERYINFQRSIVQYCEIKKEELTTEEIVQRLANSLTNTTYGDLTPYIEWEVTRWEVNQEISWSDETIMFLEEDTEREAIEAEIRAMEYVDDDDWEIPVISLVNDL